MNPPSESFMLEACRLAEESVREGRGGPFGCVVVRKGEILARGQNCVTSTNDPTAHAEIVAIRDACRKLGTFKLDDCELYSSCEPCPMCLASAYWARIPALFYGNTRADAAAIGFDDDFIYREVPLPIEKRSLAMRPFLREEAQKAFRAWVKKPDKIRY